MAAARAGCLVSAAICAVGVVACGLDFDRFEPTGVAAEAGLDASTDVSPTDGTTADTAKNDGPAPEGGGVDAPVDGPGVDAAKETGPPACPVADGVIAVPEAPGPITIDGDLSDWNNPPVTLLAADDAALITGPTGTCTAADATSQCLVPAGETAEVVLARDAGNFYVGVTVTVPTIGGTNTTDPFLNDAMEIYLRGDAVATGNYTTVDHQYVIDWQNLLLDYGPSATDTGQANPPGVTSAVKVAPSGKAYVVEMQIALAQLGQTTFTAGQDVGFDFAVDHGQGTVATRSQLVWWIATHAAPTCTTSKCTGCSPDQPYCDTLDFGLACAQ